MSLSAPPAPASARERLWRIIFLSDTPAGKAFDVALLVLIGLSVLTVMLESVASLRDAYGPLFGALEWGFTAVFTLEYVARLVVCHRPWRYARSFFGLVDLVAIAPSYLAILVPGGQYLRVVRVLRLLRMFRVLKMAQYVSQGSALLEALTASRTKIVVFMLGVGVVICVEGTAMYLVEGGVNEGFASIPHAIYWSVVTLTTVGYGDVTPVTLAGKLVATVIMLTGFGILAVPTGIVTTELSRQAARDTADRPCKECGTGVHVVGARFCHQCGTTLG